MKTRKRQNQDLAWPTQVTKGKAEHQMQREGQLHNSKLTASLCHTTPNLQMNL